MTVMNYKVANALTKIKDNEYFEQNFYDFVGFKKDYIELMLQIEKRVFQSLNLYLAK